MNKKNYDYVIIWVILTCHFIYLGNFSNLFFYGIYDYYLGVGNTFYDFFWYPSYAYINKINIFDKFLNITPSTYPPGHPAPSYSLLHTIIFIPFGILNYNLAKIFYLLTNLILLFFIYKQLKKFSQKNNKIIFFLFCLFLFSPILILCLKVGQYSIFCFWGFVIYFNNNKLFFKFLGLLIATAKYTFAPIIGLYLLFNKKFYTAFFLIITNILTILFYSIYFDISFINVLINPILIGYKTQATGAGDLLSFIGNHPRFPFNIIIVALIFFFLKYFIYLNTKRIIIFDLILICVLSLMSFRHLIYDYILLFPAILLIFEKITNKSKIISSCIIFYFLFILPCFLIEPIRYAKYFIFFNLSLNLILLIIALELILKKKSLNYLYKQYKKK
jgi:hypothetical protein